MWLCDKNKYFLETFVQQIKTFYSKSSERLYYLHVHYKISIQSNSRHILGSPHYCDHKNMNTNTTAFSYVAQFFTQDFFFFQFLNYFIVVQLQLSAFSPHLSTPPHPNQTSLPPLLPPSPLVLSMCPLQQFLKTLLPTITSPLPSGYCQIVLNFSVSGYILFAFSFC